MTLEAKYTELKNRLLEIHDLQSAAALLGWDQRSFMPPGGAQARARQISTLHRLAHTQFTDPAIGRLLDKLRPWEESLLYDSDEASLIRVTRRDFERATRIPPAFKAEYDRNAAMTYQVWAKARADDDFAAVRPYLEKTLDLSRRYAAFFPAAEHIIDPLIAMSDEGITGSYLQQLFDELRTSLRPMVQAIAEQPAPDTTCLHQHFPGHLQLEFGLRVAERFGYDLNRGRQDLSDHPISTSIALDDVRITTRVNENDIAAALFGTLHETGHAIYTQNIRPELGGGPLGRGATAGVHESQSRLWENLVGRSWDFWRFFYPELQAVFPEQLGTVTLDTFYRAINKVQPGLFRVGADEVTYSLHCAMRFQLELDLLDGRVTVADLPEVWRERFLENFGIAPSNDRDGVLQEMNWYCGRIGGLYQHFTLGNIMSAMWFELATAAHPEITTQMAKGHFDTLRAWLTEQIHTHGRKFTIPELVERVAGGSLSTHAYLGYLKQKYGELYGLSFD
ncbi:MAG: carboxypeptidase M32 [Anaerolineae bacterium]|jgi:carboxypeptidase Taq